MNLKLATDIVYPKEAEKPYEEAFKRAREKLAKIKNKQDKIKRLRAFSEVKPNGK